jgi:hypothetical protein
MNRLTRAQRRIYLQQEALRETEARQRAMIANITDVIAILDGNGRIATSARTSKSGLVGDRKSATAATSTPTTVHRSRRR